MKKKTNLNKETDIENEFSPFDDGEKSDDIDEQTRNVVNQFVWLRKERNHRQSKKNIHEQWNYLRVQHSQKEGEDIRKGKHQSHSLNRFNWSIV